MIQRTATVGRMMLFLPFIISSFLLLASHVNAIIECQSTIDCERILGRKGSDCIERQCTNPYMKGGCLLSSKPGWTKLRTCNSEDSEDFESKGYCSKPDIRFDYKEIRIHPQNWMSVSVETWILQILLSEVLDIPVTVETSFVDLNSNFYDKMSRLDFGTINNDYEAMETAKLLEGDCTKANSDDDPKNQPYKSCSHFIPENWLGLSPESGLIDTFGYDPSTEALEEPPIQLGSISQEAWYVPKFTADKDGSLLSFFGLQGDHNRPKLAQTFNRPTTWMEYCELITDDNCTTTFDRAAPRPPIDQKEANSYFVEGLYEGYFRPTDANNCTKWPTNCTGHIADFPCGWSSNLRTNTFWNDIALESNGLEKSDGYTYAQLTQMMMAANATKSDLMILWWYPDLDFQRYLGTDAELIKVTLPTVTQECLDNLVSAEDRCSTNETIRNGDERGACDDAPLPLQKVLASVTRDYSKNPDIPEELQSPAYDVLREFQMTSYQIGEVFDRFFDLEIDPDNHDLRQATCDWFVDNFDSMVKFIPEGFPRTIQAESEQPFEDGTPILYAAVSFGAASALAVVLTVAGTIIQRNQRAVKLAPIEFLFALLLGLAMVSIGSILKAMPNPNDAICIASIWMTNVGYTLEIAPIIVKMTAIFQVIRAAERMQHLEFSKKSLFTSLLAFNLVIVCFLIIWTVMDPPQKEYEYELLETQSNSDGFVIEASPYCSSEFASWYWASVAWHFFLLVIATAQAFQARVIIRKLEDENQTLAFMIYSHFIFACLRVATYWFEDSESGFSYSDLSMAQSLVYSLDTLFTIGIYFVPKLFNCFQKTTPAASSSGKDNVSGSRGGAAGSKGGVPQTKSEREYDYLARMTHVDEEIDGNENEGGDLDGFDVPSNEEEVVDITANNSIDEIGGENYHQHYEDSNPNQQYHNFAPAPAAERSSPNATYKRRPSGGDDQPGAYHRTASSGSGVARQSSGGLNPPVARQSNEFGGNTTAAASEAYRSYESSEDDFEHPGWGNDDDDDFEHPGYE